MSRKSQIDAAGVLYHIMVKGMKDKMTMLSGEMGISVAVKSRSVINGQKIVEVKLMSGN